MYKETIILLRRYFPPSGLLLHFLDKKEKCLDKRKQETAGFKICASALECEAVQPDKSTNILQHSLSLFRVFFTYFLDNKKIKKIGHNKINNNLGEKNFWVKNNLGKNKKFGKKKS